VIFIDLAAFSVGPSDGPHANLQYDEPEHPPRNGGKWDGYSRQDQVEPERYSLEEQLDLLS
jgi:hypothetical protein